MCLRFTKLSPGENTVNIKYVYDNDMNTRCSLLIAEIEAFFQEGIVLNDDICHFIRSTFSDPTFSELTSMVNDASNAEVDSLLELIFSPDEALQIRVEDILSKEWFQEKDANDLVTYFAAKEPLANVFISGYEEPLVIKMPGLYADMLVSHLRIVKKVDQRLTEAIERHIHKKDQRLIRVRLRNSGFTESKNKIDFLCELFTQYDEENVFYLKSFDFILQFFTEIQPDSKIGYSLFKKKKNYDEKIRQAVKYEEQLKKSNMETMMMQGKRNQCINIIDLQEKIDIINYLQNATRAVHD
jgi:hypothetical protein